METSPNREQWQVCRPYVELLIATVMLTIDAAQAVNGKSTSRAAEYFEYASKWLDTFERRHGLQKESADGEKDGPEDK